MEYNIALIHVPNTKLSHQHLIGKMYEYTNFYINRLSQNTSHKYDVLNCTSYDEGLKKVNETHDYVVLLCSGNRIYNSKDFMVNIIDEFESKPNLSLMGHILDRKESWYELHQQFVVVKVSHWIKSGRPSFGYEGDSFSDVVNVERSIENYHDDYTPLWVKPMVGSLGYTHLKDGWSMMNGLMKGGYDIKPFTPHIRSLKTYCYPEYNSDKFYNLIEGKEYTDDIDYTKKVLLGGLLKPKNSAWVFNTEEIETIKGDNDKVFDVVALPCAGFKFLDLLHRGFVDNKTKVYFYDFSPHSLSWFNHLLHSESCDIIEILKSIPVSLQVKGKRNETLFKDGEPTEILQKHIDEVYDYYGGFGKFSEHLTTFRSMSYELIKTNLTTNPSDVTSKLDGEYNFINVSNIYSTDYLNLFYSEIERNEMFMNLIESMSEKTLVVGRGVDTYYFEKTVNNDN